MWVNSSFTEFMHATVGHYLLQVFETTKDSNSSGRGPVVRRQITDCLCLQLLKSLGRQLSSDQVTGVLGTEPAVTHHLQVAGTGGEWKLQVMSEEEEVGFTSCCLWGGNKQEKGSSEDSEWNQIPAWTPEILVSYGVWSHNSMRKKLHNVTLKLICNSPFRQGWFQFSMKPSLRASAGSQWLLADSVSHSG